MNFVFGGRAEGGAPRTGLQPETGRFREFRQTREQEAETA